MPATYSFVSRWVLPAPPEQAWRELEHALEPGAGPRWWPGLTLPMAPRRVVAGERLVLAVRSPLGYALRVRLELTDVQPGRALGALADGDLRGHGRVEVAADESGGTTVTFRWHVETRQPWMNVTAWVLRPAFERAHAHVMRRGERGMRAVLGGR